MTFQHLMHMNDYQMYHGAFVTDEIRNIWSERSILQQWINFEVYLAQAQAELGMIPQDVADEITRTGDLDIIGMDRICHHFNVTNLNTVALIRAWKEVCKNGAGEFIHYGATSQDVLDTTLAYRISKSLDIYEADLKAILEILLKMADEHRCTIMAGITHGQHAIPVTFGFVVATWAEAIREHIERIQQARPRICVGTVSGAAGNFASYNLLFGPKCWDMQVKVLERMGLFVPRISVQPRNERFNEYMYICAMISNTLEKIAEDIIFNQRNELQQIEEPFDTEHQICSSTMPQKRNPVLCENIRGLATLIRSNANAQGETFHRDLRDDTPFFVEDVRMPETAVWMNMMLKEALTVFSGMKIHADNMRHNLDADEGLLMAEPLALMLSIKSGKKDTAMRLVHKIAMESFEKKIPYEQYVRQMPELREFMTEEEIIHILNPENYLGLTDMAIDKVIKG